MELGVVREIIKETANNWRFVIENPLYDEIKYVPGQLIQLGIPGEDGSLNPRNYSLSSYPNGTNKLEIIVTYLKGGIASEYLFKRCKVGDELPYRGPMGVFTLPKEIDRDIYFISTGSGISPFRSMVNWIANNNIKTEHVKLFFGTRTFKDIPYYKEMKELEQRLDKFSFVPTLSREKKKGMLQGYVHDHYLPLVDEHALYEVNNSKLKKPLVYYCGWGGMISQGRFELAKRGYEMQQDIKVEIFG